MLLPRTARGAGDPLRVPRMLKVPPAYFHSFVDNSTVELDHGANVCFFLDIATRDQCPQLFLSTAKDASKVVTTTISSRYKPEYHDWIRHIHLRHKVFQISNISRTPFICRFPRRLAHEVCELMYDKIFWPPDLGQQLVGGGRGEGEGGGNIFTWGDRGICR